MKTKKPATSDRSRLRRLAEKKAAATGIFADNEPGMSEQMRRTLHELRVHQIELEMQNDELRRTQVELEVSRARYFDLYDLAPVGYCTISDKILILEANLTVADLLGETRDALVRQPFTRFILPEDQDIFYLLRRKSFHNGESHACELRLLKKDGAPFWVHLVMSAYTDTDGEPGFRLVISDINERRLLEDARTFLLKCGYPGSNEDFFDSLARYLAKNLQMEYVCIDRLSGDRLSAHTVAIYNNEHFDDNASYTLKDTPCGDVVGRDICCFPADVCRLFPDDAALRELRAESFVGTTLWSFDGKPIGLISIIGRTPLADSRLAESMLRTVALRAAGELERKEHECNLIRINTRLEHQRIKLQAIIENLLEGIILCGLDGRLEKWNPAACAMHGFAHEEECVKNLSGFAGMFESRDTRGKLLEPRELPIARVIRGERLSGVEIHIRRINQDMKRILSYHGHIIRDADGGTLLAVIMIRDITHFKEAEARINDIALFPEQNPSPVLRIDSNGILLYGNPASMQFRKQWGFTPGECLPRDWNALVQRSIADNRTHCKETKVGSRIFEFTFVPLKHLKYVNVYAFDITDRKHAETALKKVRDGLEIQIRKRTATLQKTMETLMIERQRFNDVLDILPVYVVLIAPGFKVTFANRFFRERFDTVEDVYALEHHFNREIPYGSVKTVRPDETLLPQGQEWIGPDNRHYEIHSFMFSDSDGTSLLMEMGIDITDRKLAEAALVDANQMKVLGQLTSGVAHEVRNPLNGIMAIIGALSKELADDDRLHPYVQHLRTQVTRLTELMEDLLALGRPLKKEHILAIPMVTLAEKTIATWLQTQHSPVPAVRLIKPDTTRSCQIQGDSTSLMQMIINLLENARAHSPPEKEIVCSIFYRSSDKVVFSVKDKGTGISADILPKIFDPFFTTRRGGTGLGLSIVRRIVENHQGTMSVYNNTDEPGTTFEAEFPLCITAEESAHQKDSDPDPEHRYRNHGL